MTDKVNLLKEILVIFILAIAAALAWIFAVLTAATIYVVVIAITVAAIATPIAAVVLVIRYLTGS